MNRIPIAYPELKREELQNVVTCLKSSWISSTGEFISKFEENFAKWCGVKYAISCSNGTVALHLALMAINIKPDDEVIVPNFTFISTANAVSYIGAKPVLVDVNEATWNIDPTEIEKSITGKTKAVIPVHLYGFPAQMNRITKIAKKYNLFIIEDAAEAHGAQVNQKLVGSIGDIGCFSFYGNKIITTGEGGMLTTNNLKLAEKIRLLKNHGMSKFKKYWHPVVGYNYRMTNIQAAIGLAQLKKIETFLKIRKNIDTLYRQKLRYQKNIIFPPNNTHDTQGVNWLFTLLINNVTAQKRNQIILKLSAKGIESRPVFYPISHFPMYRNQNAYPVSEKLSRTGITLPTHTQLTNKEISYISSTLCSYL